MLTVRVEKMLEPRKLGFRASDQNASINSRTGDVVIQHNSEPWLHKFALCQDGSYSQEGRRECPEKKMWTHIFLTNAGDVVVQDDTDLPTRLFDQDMQLIGSWQCRGDLIACLPTAGPQTVYVVEKEQGYLIDIRSQDGEVLQLKPEGNTWESNSLCVCQDASTGKLAVLDADDLSNTMDIFSKDGM